MSRPSFEGFFPAAPAVIQQRKSKAALEKKQIASSPACDPSAAAVAAPEASVSARRNEPPAEVDGSRNTGASQSDAPNSAQDDSESVQGDLLNGVGSASSTSTASSVFSHPRPADAPHSRTLPRNTSTPLTNDEVSSPIFGKSPLHAKPDAVSVLTANMESAPLPEPSVNAATPPTRERAPEYARPGRGESRGVKIVYDPELDKEIPVRERRGRKPQYKELVGEVRSLIQKHCTFRCHRLLTKVFNRMPTKSLKTLECES